LQSYGTVLYVARKIVRRISMSMETEDLAAQVRLAKAIVWDLLEQAKKLRAKAVELERASDRLRAAAARDLAEYLEGAAAEFRRP
jgi:hypothetical protein